LITTLSSADKVVINDSGAPRVTMHGGCARPPRCVARTRVDVSLPRVRADDFRWLLLSGARSVSGRSWKRDDGTVSEVMQGSGVCVDGVGGLEAPGGEVESWFGAPMQRRLASFARRFVGADDAEDVAQEALIRAALGFEALRRAERAEAWLFRICRHTAIDHVRARRVRRRVWSPMPDDAGERVHAMPASAAAPAALAAGELWPAALGRLPAHHRLLMSLHYVKGYSQETICRMTGLSESALRVRLFRARWALLSRAEGG
jgi:RNA polymerase sigma-70 factor (ECF subfamily)